MVKDARLSWAHDPQLRARLPVLVKVVLHFRHLHPSTNFVFLRAMAKALPFGSFPAFAGRK